MLLFEKSLDTDIAIVAEVGVNHEGSLEEASNLLRLAYEAGADAVKFQTYTPARFTSTSDTGRFERVKKFSLSEAEHRQLSAEAKDLGIAFFSTAVTEDVVPLIAELGSAIKIASGDITFEPVIRAAAKTTKPIIISTGLSTIEEIDRAVEWVSSELREGAIEERLLLLHCVSAYPTPLDQANVMSVPFLRERYGLVVGYSNHVLGTEACLAAVALGARLIEVHFTDRKSDRSFRDHALSFEPDELSRLVETASNVARSLGQFTKQVQACEADNLLLIRKGVVAARDLEAGTTLHRDDLMFARPATEFAANELDQIVGQKLTVRLKCGELVPRSGLKR